MNTMVMTEPSVPATAAKAQAVAQATAEGVEIKKLNDRVIKIERDAERIATNSITNAKQVREEIGVRLAAIRPTLKAAGLSFKDFREKYAPDIKRTRLYQILAIADGTTTPEAEAAKSTARSRTQRVSVPLHGTDTAEASANDRARRTAITRAVHQAEKAGDAEALTVAKRQRLDAGMVTERTETIGGKTFHLVERVFNYAREDSLSEGWDRLRPNDRGCLTVDEVVEFKLYQEAKGEPYHDVKGCEQDGPLAEPAIHEEATEPLPPGFAKLREAWKRASEQARKDFVAEFKNEIAATARAVGLIDSGGVS